MKSLRWIVPTLILIMVVLLAVFFLSEDQGIVPEKSTQVSVPENVPDSVDMVTGLIKGDGMNLVIGHCTGCHSAELITQNRATREGWIKVIRWMQETQNLWDLGESEDAIVSYLARHYAPEHRGRRLPLTDIEWYDLEE